MQGTDWFPVALLGLVAATIILLVLLLRAQKLLRVARAQARTAANPSIGFTENQEYRLLAKQELLVAGTVHDFGVVESGSSAIHPYLVNINMHHIQAGDRFCYRNDSLYKINERNPAAEKPRVSTTVPVAPAAPPRTAPITIPPTPVEDLPAAAPAFAMNEADDRTVMYSASAAAQTDLLNGLTYLEVIEGPDAGTRFPLAYAESTIGRSESNSVMLSDEGASRQHCKILYNAPNFILADAQSTNGTLCNNELIDAHPLEFGDQIQVADSVMLFTCRGHDLKESDPAASIAAFESCLEIEPDFLLALKNLAFLLERDLRRNKDAEPLWRKIAQLEKAR